MASSSDRRGWLAREEVGDGSLGGYLGVEGDTGDQSIAMAGWMKRGSRADAYGMFSGMQISQ